MAAMMEDLGMNLSNLLFNLTFILREPFNQGVASPEESGFARGLPCSMRRDLFARKSHEPKRS